MYEKLLNGGGVVGNGICEHSQKPTTSLITSICQGTG